MNINNIVKLAKQDNETLVILVNRWMLDKSRIDPIPDILLKSQGIFYGFIGFLTSLCAVGLVVWETIYHHFANRTKNDLLIWIILVSLVSLSLLISWKMHRIKSKISDAKNADEFCLALSLVEQIYLEGNAMLNIWQDKLEIAASFGRGYFYSQADQLEKLEKVSWRKEDARKLREIFRRELGLLSNLLVIPSNYREYFGSPKEPVPAETAVTA